MEILDVILRCLISLVTLFFVTKMIGKGPLFQQPVEQEDTHHADA